MILKKDEIITSDKFLQLAEELCISYIKTDFFYVKRDFVWRGKKHPEAICDIAIIGHSDYPLTDEIANKFKICFGTNNLSKKSNVFGLPLGITNDCDDSNLHKIYGNLEVMIDVSQMILEKESMVYLNFDYLTNPPEREPVYRRFLKEKYTNVGKIDNTIDGRKDFLIDIKKSNFVLCPRGNGIDTHRLWETLYMGSIPIVKRERAHHLFYDLPILFVDSWEQITENFLSKELELIRKKDWNLEKLNFSFWKSFISTRVKQ